MNTSSDPESPDPQGFLRPEDPARYSLTGSPVRVTGKGSNSPLKSNGKPRDHTVAVPRHNNRLDMVVHVPSKLGEQGTDSPSLRLKKNSGSDPSPVKIMDDG